MIWNFLKTIGGGIVGIFKTKAMTEQEVVKLKSTQIKGLVQLKEANARIRMEELRSPNATWLQKNTRPLGVWVCVGVMTAEVSGFITPADWVHNACMIIIGGYYGARSIDKFSTRQK